MESKQRSQNRSASGSTEKNKRARHSTRRPQCPPIPYLQILTSNFHKPEKILLLLSFFSCFYDLAFPLHWCFSNPCSAHSTKCWRPQCAPALNNQHLTPTLSWKSKVHVHQPLLQPPHRPEIKNPQPVHTCSLVFALEIRWKWKSDSVK